MFLDNIKLKLNKIINDKNIKDIKKYITKKEEKKILDNASQLLNNIFVFNKRWDMERCVIEYKLEPLDFKSIRNDDQEWCFMLNRMDYLIDLIMASIITNNLDYVKHSKKIIFTFIDQHKEIKESISTRTLDTSIRLFNIVQALPYLIYFNCLSDEELEKIINSINLQIIYLKEKYIYKYKLSNWGSIQTCSILSILLLLDDKNSEIFEWGKKELLEQFKLQIYEDGYFWEQSTMYQGEVLLSSLKLIYYAKLFNYKLDNEIYNKTYKMLKSLYLQILPNGEINTFGDSDRILALDIFKIGSVIFKDATLKYICDKNFDYENLYSYGVKYANKYFKLNKQKPQILNYESVDSGMYIIRSDWSKNATYTMFTNGSLGSGHGHCDNLSFTIFYKGQNYFIDKGRYTYNENDKRIYFKSQEAHNTVIIDDKPICIPNGSWTFDTFVNVNKIYSKSTKNIHYIESSVIGNNICQIWIRKMYIINPNIWVIVDEINQDGSHIMKNIFHIDTDIEMINNYEYRLIGNKSNLKIYNKNKSYIKDNIYSPKYNEIKNIKTIYYENKFNNKGNNISIITDDKFKIEKIDIFQNEINQVKEDLGQAYKITISDDEYYIIIALHSEIYKGVKLLSCDGINFHTKSLVIHNYKNKKTIYTLRT